MTTALISHQDCLLHDMGDMHPESPDRLRAIQEQLSQSGLAQDLQWIEARPAGREQILLAHPEHYVSRVEALSPTAGTAMIDPDTSMCPDSLRAALLAAGAAVQATDLVYSGEASNVFCAVRPPGHHAEYDQGMGFCLFNNIAIAVRHAMQAHGAERAAVLDFDVHHCNGTVDIFKDDPAVLVCSSFQHPFYPMRYYDIERPNIINTPLSAGTPGKAFRLAVERDWIPAVEAHRPDIIFVSAGFDAHRDDPLGELRLDESDYAWVSSLIMDLAQRFASSRIVAMLEGGYNLQALASSVEAQLEVFAGHGSGR